MNALDEKSEGTSRSHKGTVGKVVKNSRNNDQGSYFAQLCSAENISFYKISFTVSVLTRCGF